MDIARKVRKLIDLDAWYSARAAIRRLAYPLPVQPFLDAMDMEAFERVRARYFDPEEKVAAIKYLNLDEWMGKNVKRVRDHRIRKAPPKLRILDIGCGCGYFLHILRCMGHDVVGLDVEAAPVIRDTIALLKIPLVIHRIEAFEPLPDFGAKFDYITGHMTCFNIRADGSHWGKKEWEYFLNDLLKHLNPGGKIEFDLNALPDGRHMEPELRDWFRAKGAEIDRRKVYFKPPFLA